MKQWLYVYRQWFLRDLRLRYRSSALGTAWLVLQPLAQILLFTLVFHRFFGLRWPTGDGSVGEYGLQVFIGLSLYTFVADVINRSPASVSSYPFLVTKVRFPLVLLPVVVVGVAGVQLVLSLAIAVLFAAWREAHAGALLLPLLLVPLAVYALALSWLFGAAGVYLRDVGHLAPSLGTLLLFLSPVFYPASMVPGSMRWLMIVNPLAWSCEAARDLLMSGQMFDGLAWTLHLAAAGALAVAAWAFFARIERGFADVL